MRTFKVKLEYPIMDDESIVYRILILVGSVVKVIMIEYNK